MYKMSIYIYIGNPKDFDPNNDYDALREKDTNLMVKPIDIKNSDIIYVYNNSKYTTDNIINYMPEIYTKEKFIKSYSLN